MANLKTELVEAMNIVDNTLHAKVDSTLTLAQCYSVAQIVIRSKKNLSEAVEWLEQFETIVSKWK